jgi:uncharacterized protein
MEQINSYKSHQIETNDRQCLNLYSLPKKDVYISSIELDLTWKCNLNCFYCYKHKGNRDIDDRTAFDAIVWLLYASGPETSIRVTFLGGEPLLAFNLIKKLVPFGVRRAREHNKNIRFSMTTNCTLVTDEVINFAQKWDIRFHSSIDGIPKIQNKNRPQKNGTNSSFLVEQAVPKLLSYQSNCTARCTVVPESVGYLYGNYQYFRSLGYCDIAFVPGLIKNWNDESIFIFENEFKKFFKVG